MVLVALANVLAFNLAVRFLGDIGFAQYALGRRALALVLPAAMLGLGVSLPRYVAMTTNSGARGRLVLRAVAGLALSNVALWGGAWLFRADLANLLFGDGAATVLLAGVGVALGGGCAHGVAYGYLRGALYVPVANGLNAIALGATPLIAVVLSGGGAASVFFLQGAILAGLATVTIGIVLATSFGARTDQGAESFPLYSYGFRRVPGDFALMALLSAPSLLAVSLFGVEVAGMVAFGTTLVTLFGTALSPVSTLLLPYVAGAQDDDALSGFRASIFPLAQRLLAVGVAGSLVFTVFSEPIIHTYLGPTFAARSFIPAIMVWGGVAYGVHVALRSIVDAVEFKALNSGSTLIALATFSVWVGGVVILDGTVSAMLVGFVLAVAALGAQTWWHATRALSTAVGDRL